MAAFCDRTVSQTGHSVGLPEEPCGLVDTLTRGPVEVLDIRDRQTYQREGREREDIGRSRPADVFTRRRGALPGVDQDDPRPQHPYGAVTQVDVSWRARPARCPRAGRSMREARPYRSLRLVLPCRWLPG